MIKIIFRPELISQQLINEEVYAVIVSRIVLINYNNAGYQQIASRNWRGAWQSSRKERCVFCAHYFLVSLLSLSQWKKMHK